MEYYTKTILTCTAMWYYTLTNDLLSFMILVNSFAALLRRSRPLSNAVPQEATIEDSTDGDSSGDALDVEVKKTIHIQD